MTDVLITVAVIGGSLLIYYIIAWSLNQGQKKIDKTYGNNEPGLKWYIHKPLFSDYKFTYPYQIYEIDITGKRNANLIDYIDEWINNSNMYKVETGHEEIKAWKKDCENIISAIDISDELRSRYNLSLDDGRAFKFKFIRYITKTKQKKIRY